jgi:hypothetical protein
MLIFGIVGSDSLLDRKNSRLCFWIALARAGKEERYHLVRVFADLPPAGSRRFCCSGNSLRLPGPRDPVSPSVIDDVVSLIEPSVWANERKLLEKETRRDSILVQRLKKL